MDSRLFALSARWKVGTRIFTGFASVLLILAAIAGLATFGFNRLGHEFERFSDMAHDAQLVTELETKVTNLQLQVREYLSTANPDELQQAKAAYGSLDALVDQARGEIHKPERAALVADIDKLTGDHRKGFDQVVVLIDRRNSLVSDQLSPIGQTLRERLTAINESAYKDGDFKTANYAGVVQEDLLTARLYVNRFLLSNAAEDAERVRAELQEVSEGLRALDASIENPGRKKLASDVASLLPKYTTAFEGVVKTIADRNAIRETVLTAVGISILAKAEAVKASAEADMKALDKAVQAELLELEIEETLLGVGAIVIGMIVAWFITVGITRPTAGMVTAMSRLAEGQLQTEVPGLHRRDEIGAMAQTLGVFKENLIEADRMRSEQTSRAQQAVEEKRRDMARFADEFQTTVGAIVDTVANSASEMEQAAEALTRVAAQSSQQAMAAASAVTQASSNVQTVAAAGEELSNSITEISRQVSRSTGVSGKAVEQAERTNTRMAALSESAQRIGEVIQLISDIAAQTNLLALNATIEAARAGEAGKGFAVVASEVKSLATQTAKATGEISQQIGAIQSATGESAESIAAVGHTIAEMNEITTTIAAAVEEQGSATQEIARNVQEAAVGTHEASSHVEGVSASADGTGSASTQVLSTAQQMSQEARNLRSQVDAFITRVRAA